MKTTEDEDKRRQGNGQNLIILKFGLLGQILKNEHIYFFGAWSLFLVHIQFTPSAGPEGFVIYFLRNQIIEVGSSSWTMEIKRPSFMVHDVNCP